MSLKNINPNPRLTKYLIKSKIFNDEKLVVADVGARGGFEKHWSFFNDQIKLIGFEPDKKECQYLNENEKSSNRIYYPYALHEDIGNRKFYSTAWPASSGFYKPDSNQLNRFPDKVNLEVVDSFNIPTISIDRFIMENKIDNVDFIKLDTEGCELDILKGALKALNKCVLGLSIEVWFQPWHEKQPLFSDLLAYLEPLGFKLYDLETYRMRRDVLPEISSSPIPGPTNKGQIISGEALFIRDNYENLIKLDSDSENWNDIKILKLASIFDLFCLQDCAVELLFNAKKSNYLKNIELKDYLDLLVDYKKNNYLKYNAYIKECEKIKKRGYKNMIEKIKILVVKILPSNLSSLLISIYKKIKV